MNKDDLKFGHGVFTDREIRQAIDSGQIVCRPFKTTNLSLTSLDVSLGEWYYRTESSRASGIYNPFDKASVQRYFDGPHRAMTNRDWAEQAGRHPFAGIAGDCPVIVLGPHERILAHTQEFVGIRWGGTSMMKARSTWGPQWSGDLLRCWLGRSGLHQPLDDGALQPQFPTQHCRAGW